MRRPRIKRSTTAGLISPWMLRKSSRICAADEDGDSYDERSAERQRLKSRPDAARRLDDIGILVPS